MKRALAFWNTLGTRSSLIAGVARFAVYAALLFLAFECITIRFNWPEQLVLGTLTILLTYAIHRVSDAEVVTLALMFASILATARYAYWRIATVGEAIANQGSALGWANIFFMLVLLSAEFYAFVILFLGYIQTIRPLRRRPVPLPRNIEEWPHVDVLVPTYNEPLSVVRATAFAALNMDYPQEKLHVYVLDDGRREEFRKFCEEADVGYITRKDNKHAKAGNINHALKLLDSPYVAIFDCDHVPTRSFLQVTLGWFLKDKKLGMLQTPHFFYSPDPFERNLHQFMSIPNEGELFYGVVQDGNDLWNATFFCGSCAVLRRTALDEIGGIATETVTEDAHTSLRMQMHGWNTAYINIPQAAGLATESLSSHVGQRIRWARGMVQVMRTDNPLTAKGLKWPQRLCYFNAMVHFLYAGPRLIFLTAPLVYMLLGRINIPGYWIAIAAYALPHLFLANVTNFRVQGRHRYSFWNEVYETVLAPYILGPTLLAFLNPKLGKFNVTAKGGIVRRSYFDKRIALPYIILILLDVAALVVAPVRFFYWNAGHPGTVIMNVVWVLFNMVIVGTANAVAFESKQLRKDVRISLKMPVQIKLPNGKSLFGETEDISRGGAWIKMEIPLDLPPATRVQVVYPLRGQEAEFPAEVVKADGLNLRLHYAELSLEEEELLTLVLYSGADTWLSRSEFRQPDKPMRSFLRLVRLSVKGVGLALSTLLPRRTAGLKAARVEAAILLAAVLMGGCSLLHAQSSVKGVTAPIQAEGTFHTSFSLKDIGVPESVVFRGVASGRDISFALPPSNIAQQASLHLQYAFSPGLIAQMSHLSVLLNGTLVATVPVPQNRDQVQGNLALTVPLPAELLVRNNVLGFQFVGHYTQQCEDPANTTLWARVENTSQIEVSGSLLPLADDLKILPLPFYDGAVSGTSAAVPFAFASSIADPAVQQAAGIVASWFGVTAKSRPLSFPVSTGDILPKGNVVLFADSFSDLPPGLGVSGDGAVVAVRTNPNDPYGKVLVLVGNNGEQLVTAARALALGNSLLQGKTARISGLQLPDPRQADDAPLWLKTGTTASLWDYAGDTDLQSDGSGPLAVYLRVPPDLYYGDRQDLSLHVDYRYNAISLANASTLRITANGGLVNELPLPHENNPKKALSYDVAVPLVNMRPFANTFLFNFYFQIAKMGNCQDTPPINLQGTILRSSYLDLRGLQHWAAMPNLELFANAGFPFTRFADLSQSRIILPAQPSQQEMEVYLMLLAYFGEQTGYPALRVQTGDASKMGGDEDYLVLGTAGDQPAFARLNGQLPVRIQEDGLTVRDTGGLFAAIKRAWWQVAEMRPDWWWKLGRFDRDGLIESLGQLPDALLQGIESPWKSRRSVITITFRDNDAIEPFMAAFWKTSMSGDIGESVSVLHGKQFSSYRLGERYYHIGDLPLWARIRYWLRTFPWLIVVLTFVLGVFIVPWTKLWLDRRVQARLEAKNV